MFKKTYLHFGSATLSVFLLLGVLFFLSVSGSTQNGPKDRIVYAVDSSRISAVKGTAHPLAQPQFDRGRLSPERQLSGVALTFRLSAAQQSDLHQLLREQQDRSSSHYHKW